MIPSYWLEYVGVEYGLDTNYGNSKSVSGNYVRGDFSVFVSSLICNTLYHYRVFVTNGIDTDYGNDATFNSGVCGGATSTLYGIDGSGNNPDAPNLLTIDPATGDTTVIGPVGYYITGLAFHPDTGILYGVSGNTGDDQKSLFTVDTSTGAGTLLGALEDADENAILLPDISFRSDGRLYGFSNDDNLYEVDLTSCNGIDDFVCLVAEIGNSGEAGNSGYGIAFNGNDNLFLFALGNVSYNEIDPDTGLITSTRPFSNPGVGDSIGAAVFNENDIIFGAIANAGSPSYLFIIDQNVDTIFSAGDNTDMNYISAIAFKIVPAVVPPPEVSSGTTSGSTRRVISPVVPTVCPVGHLFSTSTGLPCTAWKNVTTTPTNCIINTTLKLGSRGDQVKCLQTGLKILSDGIFGPMTKASVISFQQLNNLVQDGIFGPKSLEKWGK